MTITKGNVYHAFPTYFDRKTNQIITDVFVSDTLQKVPVPAYDDPQALKCKSLWDTGATNTVISQRLVTSLNLSVISKTQIFGVNNLSETTIHAIDLWLPNHCVIRKIPAAKGELSQDSDVLIGMDIISRGDLSISNFNDRTIFSFRYPSVGNIDFVAVTEKT